MSWTSKLENKLSTLTETSSQESLTTVAKWICFNRKQAASFCQVLSDRLSSPSPGKQMIMIDLIDCVLLNDKGSSAWDRGLDLRRTIGESVLLPNLEKLDEAGRNKISACAKEWDDSNSFGGPTIINLIRKQVTSLSKSVKEEPEPQAIDLTESPKDSMESSSSPLELPVQSLPTPSSAPVTSPNDENDENDDLGDLAPLSKRSRTSDPTASGSALMDAVHYDFESSGIPHVPTDPSQLVDSCNQVANLQIARDIRKDSAIQLNSLFTSLPEDVRRSCAEAAETEGDFTLPSDDTARDYGVRVNQTLIDMDMKEQLVNLFQLRKLIEQQREARQSALKLLVQSRCKFGSEDAAAAFCSADRGKEELSKRRQILLDALELEGFGLEDDDTNEHQKGNEEVELEPLSWYKGDA